MARFFVYSFSVGGDNIEIPDTTQPSGAVSYESGFTSNYELPFGTNPAALPVSRIPFNGVLFDITDALQQYQTHGFPDFATTADNDGSPYSYDIFAIVRFNPGSGFQLYMNTVQDNTTIPTDPSWTLLTGGSGFGVPPGTSLPYNGGTIPNGYLLEDGTVHNIVDYPNLFAAIGNTFGGDGITTFAVPNSTRRVLMGSGGSGTAIIGNAVGDSGGEEAHVQTLTELAAHTHLPLSPTTNFVGGPLVAGAFGGGGSAYQGVATTGSTGSSTAANVIQPSRIVNWIIKY